MADEFIDKPVINKPVVGIAVAVGVVAVSAWFYWNAHESAAPAVPQSTAPPVPAPPPDDRVEHPVPTAQDAAAKEALPDLADSDPAISAALEEAGGAMAKPYLVPDNIIRHIVVTVDNVPRQRAAVAKRPIVPAAGTFVAAGDEIHATLDRQNYQRYEPMVALLRKADMQRLAGVYLRFYPLFQKAYQDLGYPNGYFNDRLVQAIDLLLATPQMTGPIELVRPNVMYVFADPTLEARPAGQKILIRMGPDNAAAGTG
ncbi:MAG: DUF3014 domain-containing protein [Pseudomonadota bacterium]|nr:DUF3014 domain-containing protein [Pseudomonadota bacterium]